MNYQKSRFNLILVTPYNEKHLVKSKGGIGRWSIMFIEFLRKQNVNISVIDTTPLGKRLVKNNARKNIFLEVLRAMIILAKTYFQVKKRRKNTILHLNSSLSNLGIYRDYLTMKIALKNKAKIVLHLHCNVDNAFNKSKSVQRYLKTMLDLSSVVLVLNNQSLNVCNKISKSVVYKIPNFVDDNDLIQSKMINEIVERIVFVGFIQEEKGINEILFLAEKFREIEFKLVGTPNPHFERVKFPKNVSIVGNAKRKDVYDILDQSDIFLFLSHTEGFSIALLEAMTRGLPVLCTNVGANEEMLGNDGGIIIEVKDTKSAEKAIVSLLSPDVRRNQSIHNLNRVRENYTISKVGNDIMKIYEGLIE